MLAVAALIFAASAQGNARLAQDPATDWVLRKIAHLGVYAVLGFLAASALRALTVRHPAVITMLLGTLYAAGDEFHQSLVPGRSPQASDVLIDVIGLAIGLSVWRLLVGLRETRRRRL